MVESAAKKKTEEKRNNRGFTKLTLCFESRRLHLLDANYCNFTEGHDEISQRDSMHYIAV